MKNEEAVPHYPAESGTSVYQLNCAGTESRLDACTHGWIGYPSSTYCSATSAVDAGVACEAPDDGQLRLVDGNGYNSGRVEIKFAGGWRRICDYGWGSNDAAVVCRQLGYSGYVSSARADGDIRLQDGDTQYQGRVEIYYSGEWRRVCEEGWGLNDAKVACKQLGYEDVHTAYINYNPRGTGSYWLSDINCAGTEEGLYNCSSRGWGTINSYCGTGDYDDAGVICKAPGDGAVRLVNTTSPYEGRVEVYYGGEWGRVCDYNWGFSDAKVVCRQLGLAGAHTSFRGWSPRGTVD
ncbi:scavenger receptor cysteine-rich type 1 protein M130-like [Lingula anatina]|uniref:Scavenger receptor cysteine-rich type 1 protein M130-like n=1 Tax=Lingula anatina TaxID=7574 RepID=A0A2R2MTT8_LINAN|nr:scavenger receptor cysteine-rich type 1 protein M130-like [Lingula anatina]|eukprot:XP_023933538.1 scavenger receptor cysteine-rich type 1 protein M130-like [Lingula anatina]